jgi:excisionase family DNA binding protein
VSGDPAETAQTGERLTLTADEVAALLGISRSKVYDAIHAGELPSIRFGRRVLVPASRFYDLVNGGGPSDSTSPIVRASA